MEELAIRQGIADDWPAVARLLAYVFHAPLESSSFAEAVFEPDRSLVIEDAGAVVAHAAAFTRELTVPGGPVPAAHVSLVGVAPTHRRRGLLTRLMDRQLAEVPEPITVLWASEEEIYPRFGYAMASRRVSFTVDTREVRLPEPADPGTLRSVPAEQSRAELARVHDTVRVDRPGWSSRDEHWWNRRLEDRPDRRGGASELRVTLHEGPTGVDGYAIWRAKGNWGSGGPEGEVQVTELVAATPQAHLVLWRFLLAVDLTRSATLWLGGLDDPLLQLANAARRLGTTLGDGLFVRIVDLPAALSARRYAAPVEVVFDVTDPQRPANTGRWRLSADGEKVSCTRTDQPADLSCGIGELGAAYLGGIPLGALAAAGRVRELRPGSLAPASAAFGWHRSPTGIEIF